MKPRETIFYSSCNAEYFYYALTALLSVREQLPNAKLHLLCKFLTIKQKELLKNNDITFTEIDLTEEFSKAWKYPLECYYIFYGPEFFYKEGYKYAVYIDSDVLCLKNPLLKKAPKGISGVGAGKIEKVLGDDVQEIKKLFGLDTELKRKRVQSGVVYFNTETMSRIKLFKSSVEMYKTCLENNAPRKGDDSLFAILQAKYINKDDVTFLKDRFNYIYQRQDKSSLSDIVFFHFTNIPKPWSDKIVEMFLREYESWKRIYRHVYSRVEKTKKTKRIKYELCNVASKQRLNILSRKINSRKKPLLLYWYRDPENGIYNFGDEFTAGLIPYLTGRRVEWAPIEKCEIVGIGSLMEAVLNNCRQDVKTWCTSYIKEGKDKNLPYNIHPLATRGKNSAKRMMLPNIPIGDAGVFASILYPKNKENYTDKIGIVAHYVDLNNPIIQKARKDPRYMIISPLQPPYLVAQQIASCKCVLSSSLHGLIFADSYGVPNIHITLSDKVTGGSYKFIDYYTGIDSMYKNMPVKDIFNQKKIQRVINEYKPINNIKEMRNLLLEALVKGL